MRLLGSKVEILDFKDMNLLDFGNNILIGGVVYSGNGKNHICLLPDDADITDHFVVLELDSDEWKQVIRQTDLMETEILQQHLGAVTKAIVRKSTRMIEQGLSWRVYKRDDYKCRYCGKDGIPMTVDHLILWEEGGPSIEKNLVTACRRCNKTRGSTPYKDWLEHPYYLKVSKKLHQDVLDANLDLVDTLEDIPVRIHVRSR
jgi:5-methylcytosine-specific restriction endonuclease McrA